MAGWTMSHTSKTPVKRIFSLSPHSGFESESAADSGLIHPVSRLPENRDSEFLYLGMRVHGSDSIDHQGTEVLQEPGDLVFYDPDRHIPELRDDCRLMLFRVSRRHLGVSESDLRHVVGVPVRGGEGVGAMVSIFLSALATEMELRRSGIGDRLTRSAVDLLTVLVAQLLTERSEHKPSGASSIGTEMLARIREFIEEHLMDPDLSPQSIARAHHISVRYLHKLFQNDGTTVSQWIRQRRLDLCREELGRMSNRRLPVAAVAHRWGFTSASHFSRVFRDAYGMSPSAWRACA